MEKKEMKNELTYSQEELSKHGIMLPKNYSDQIFNTLNKYQESGRLMFPKNYNLGNAITNAYLTISQDSKLKVCSSESIIQSVIDMTTMGLNVGKKQCYFIPMGTKCTLMPSVFGKIHALRQIKGVKDVRTDVIYENTEYELFVDDYGNDDIRIIKPCPLKDRKQDKIEGAWCRIILDEDVWGTSSYVSIMTIDDIKNAHKLGNAKGSSKAHQDFLNEMAKKSVINRCAKYFINTMADDSPLVETIIKNIDNEYHNENVQEEYYKESVVDTKDIFNNKSKNDKNIEDKDKVVEKEVVDVEVVEKENNFIDETTIEF